MSTARRRPAFLPASLTRAMTALALLALAIVLLRPICDALEPGPAAVAGPSSAQQDHHSPDEPCCASIEATSIASSPATIAGDGSSHELAPQSYPALRASAASLRRAALDPPPRPQRSLPFHVRTARILA